MKLALVSISCVLGLLAAQAFAGDRVLGGAKPRDCSQLANAAKKAHCEAVNKAKEACKGKKVRDELTICLMEQGRKK